MNYMKNKRVSLVFEPSEYYSYDDISVDGVRGKMWLVDEEQDVKLGDKVWYKSGNKFVSAIVSQIKNDSIKLDYTTGHPLVWTSNQKFDLIIGDTEDIRYQKYNGEVNHDFVYEHDYYRVEYITNDMLVQIYKNHTQGFLRLLTKLKTYDDGQIEYFLVKFNNSFIYYP
jgi:hypothetical protein